jgi:hypothetical protein
MDGWLYCIFGNWDENDTAQDETSAGIYRVRLESNQNQSLTEATYIRNLTAIGDFLYYVKSNTSENGMWEVFKMDVNTLSEKKVTTLPQYDSDIVFSKDEIYYECGGICRYDMNTNKSEIITNPSVNPDEMAVHDNTLYYSVQNKGVYTIGSNSDVITLYSSDMLETFLQAGEDLLVIDSVPYDDGLINSIGTIKKIGNGEVSVLKNDIHDTNGIFALRDKIFYLSFFELIELN